MKGDITMARKFIQGNSYGDDRANLVRKLRGIVSADTLVQQVNPAKTNAVFAQNDESFAVILDKTEVRTCKGKKLPDGTNELRYFWGCGSTTYGTAPKGEKPSKMTVKVFDRSLSDAVPFIPAGMILNDGTQRKASTGTRKPNAKTLAEKQAALQEKMMKELQEWMAKHPGK